MKSGFVSIIGRPNVGKSTLLNSLINEKVAIVSDKSGTTRNIIEGIYNDSDYQIVFVDTPGIHKPVEKLSRILNKEALSLTSDVDLILFVVDAASGIGKGDKYILDILHNENIPVVFVLNKIDEISDNKLLKIIDENKDLYPFSDIVPISALTHDNISHLLDVIKKYMNDNILYFPQDIYTTNSVRFMVSEIVREKLLNVLEEEIPHCITCYTVKYEEKKDIINILVDIIVDRDSQKKIVIGKNGSCLKQVGTLARIDIEKLVNKKVYLELYVKVISNWRNKEKYLTELGFKNNE